MDDSSIPWTPDYNVGIYDNVVACMTRKGLPIPPRHAFTDIRGTFDALHELNDIFGGPDITDAAQQLMLARLAATEALEPASLALVEFSSAALGALPAAYYLSELQGCFMRTYSMSPPTTLGDPQWRPGLPADPGPPHADVWPIAPPELREPPPAAPDPIAPPPATSKVDAAMNTVLAVAGGLALALIVMIHLNKTSSSPGPSSGGSGSYSLRWSCGNRDQCAMTMGSYTGTAVQGVSFSECQAAQQRFKTSMQPASAPGQYGSWCASG